MATGYYYGGGVVRRDLAGGAEQLPTISTGLDSVRAYQWEINFVLPDNVDAVKQDVLTLAAKQVTALGFSTEAIEVHRVNDKVFYPGKASPEEITVTFDNFYSQNAKVSVALWNWFQTIYNPMTGAFGQGKQLKKFQMNVVHLNAAGSPDYQTTCYGVYPQSWKTAEFNYGTNEFHTIEVVFKYDFMNHAESVTATPGDPAVFGPPAP